MWHFGGAIGGLRSDGPELVGISDTKKSQDLDNQSSGIFRSATRIRTWE